MPACRSRFPISILLIVANVSDEMSPLATTFSVSVMEEPLPRSTVPRPASRNADGIDDIVADAARKARRFVTVPTVKSTVVALVRTMVSLLAPPSIELARDEVAVGQVDRVVADPRDRVRAIAACDGLGVGTAGDREGFGLTRQGDRDAAPAVAAEIASTPDRCVRSAQCVRLDDVDVRLIVSPVPDRIHGARADQDCIDLSASRG